jgi:quinol monooxygenase YgiN
MPISIRLKIARRPMILFLFLALLIPAAIASVGRAFAQEPAMQARIYVVTHVDVLPQAPVSAATILLKQYAADSRKESGAVRIEVYAQISRLNHFSVVEVWKDQQAFDAHEAAAHTKQFRNKIQPMLGSPFDERLHQIVE